MNHYTQILSYIKQLADSDPLVNTVSQGEADKKLFDKVTMFPLVHIYVGGFTYGENYKTLVWKKIKVITSGGSDKLDEMYGEDKDGYVVSLSIEVPNDTINLCQYPI